MEREEVRPQACFLVGQTEFPPQVVPMHFHGLGTYMENIGNLLGALALHDEIGDIDLSGRQFVELGR
jgi:hypothetical protein